MDGLINAIIAVYDWMHIRWPLCDGLFEVSFWELFTYSVLAMLLWFIVWRIYDADD